MRLASPALVLSLAIPALPQIFSSNFDNESLSCWNTRNSEGKVVGTCGSFSAIEDNAIQLVQDEIYRGLGCGTKSLRINFGVVEDEGRASVGITPTDAVYVRAYYYFGPGFDFPQGLKIGKVRGPAGSNSFDFILQTQSASHSSSSQEGEDDNVYLGMFHNNQPSVQWWPEVKAIQAIQRETWHCIEYKVVMNTPGTSNGQVQVWFNGTSIASSSSLNLRSSTTWKINEVRFGGNYSNTANGNSTYYNPATSPSQLYIDDVAISSGYIGCN